jgi:hypothetical protein
MISCRRICRKRTHRLVRMISLPFTLIALSLTPASSIKAASKTNLPYCPVTHLQDGSEIVKGQDLLDAMKRDGDDIDCSGKTVEGDLELYKLPETLDNSEPTILIKRGIIFHYADIHSVIRSWDENKALNVQPHVKFLKGVDFIGTHFHEDVSFDGATFVGKANFSETHFPKLASYTGAAFDKNVSFRSAQFDERALFTGAKFEDEADFALAVFNRLAFFSKSEFRNQATFLFTRFNGDTLLSRAHFHGLARFVGTAFRGPTYFSYTTFEDQVWFIGGAQFNDTVTFKDSVFVREGQVTVEGQRARAPVLFGGVVFAGDATFSNARFHHVAFAESYTLVDIGRDTVFRKRAIFRGTTFDTLGLERSFCKETSISRGPWSTNRSI